MGGSGAGSGGGGGSSGTIDYPAYMKERHSALYDSIKDAVAKAQSSNPYNYVQAWDPSYSMYKMEAIANTWYRYYDRISPAALWECVAGSIPAKAKNIYKPAEYQSMLDAAAGDKPTSSSFENSIGTPDWDGVFDTNLLRSYLQRIPLDYVWDNTQIDEYLGNAMQGLCESARDEVIPQYRRGMQDIGAVMTSAYKIGEALLWRKVMLDAKDMQKEIKMKVVEKEKDAKIALAMSAYEVAGKLALTNYEKKADYEILKKEYKMKYGLTDADLASSKMEMMGKFGLLQYEQIFKSTGDVLNLALQKIGWMNQLMHYYLEVERMTYTAMKEYTDSKNIYKIEQTKWNLEMFKYQMDALGSIASSAGTSYTTSSSGTSRLSSAIGGALTGASAGMMVGGATGAAMGGPVGAAIGGAVGLIGGIL